MTSASAARISSAESSNILGDVAWQPMDHRLWPVIENLASGQYDLLSCDFFDTLLWRVTPHPSDVFPFVYHTLRNQGALAPHVTVQLFDSARKLAEEKARIDLAKCCGSGEVNLKEIYRKLPNDYFTGARPEDMATIEEHAEHVLLRRDESFVRLLGWAQRRNIPYVIASDTFYSAQALLGMMDAAGWPKNLRALRVFASNELRRGKAQGLMARVAETMGIAPARILHIGDNFDADVKGPRASGLRCVLVERTPQSVQVIETVEPKRAVQLRGPLLSEHADFGLAALRRRLAFEAAIRCPNESLRPYWSYGALVLGPVLTALGEWIREKTSSIGDVHKIYCLQREGDFFCRLLATLERSSPAHIVNAPLQTFSLPASRLAMMKCVVEGTDADSLMSFAGGLPISARFSDFISYLGIEDEPLGSFKSMKNLQVAASASAELELLCRYIAGSDRLSSRINGLALQRCKRFARIAMEGDLHAGETNEPFVLADLGYNGTIQKLIARIFRRVNISRRVMGLYMVTNVKIVEAQLDGSGPACGYLADAGKPIGFASIDLRNHPIIEQALMPNMGSIVDFGETGPVRQALAVAPAQQKQQVAVQEGILACADVWPRLCRELELSFTPDNEVLKSRLRAIAERAMGEPTQDELKTLGQWHHEINLGSTYTAPLLGQPERHVAVKYAPLLSNLQDSDLWLYAKLKQADSDAHNRVLNVVRATGEQRFVAFPAQDRLFVDLMAYLEGTPQDEKSLSTPATPENRHLVPEILNVGKGIPVLPNERGLLQVKAVFPVSPQRKFQSVSVRFAPADGLLRIDGAELLWSRETSVSHQMQAHRHLADGEAVFAWGAEDLIVEGSDPITGQLYAARHGLTVRIKVPPLVGLAGGIALNLYLAFIKDKENGFERWAAIGSNRTSHFPVVKTASTAQPLK